MSEDETNLIISRLEQSQTTHCKLVAEEETSLQVLHAK